MTPDRGRAKPEDRARASVYWAKAQRFAQAARANAADRNWDPATANAVNAIIHAVDAACVHYLGERNNSGHHEDALGVLSRANDLAQGPRAALEKQLLAALGKKSLAQVEGRLCSESDARDALRSMDRALKALAPVAEANGWR